MSLTITFYTDSSGATELDNPQIVQAGGVDLDNDTYRYSDVLNIYIGHDGVNPIENCEFYIQPYSGTYTGTRSAIEDYNEFMEWGNHLQVEPNKGGFFIDPGTGILSVCRNEQGCIENPLPLDAGSIGVGAREMIRVEIVVPAYASVAGLKTVEMCMTFTYTS